MCLECLTGLGTCKKSWSLSGHRLYPMIRRCRYKIPELANNTSSQNTSGGQPDDVSQSLYDQANKFKEQENWVEAEATYLQVLSRREKDHGIDDDLLRNSYYELGIVYHKLDKLDESSEKLEKALNGEDKVYGPDDSRTLYTAFELGKVYKKLNKNDFSD